jgi:hypothetical protein
MNIVIAEEYDVRLITVHLEKKEPRLCKMDRKTSFILVLMHGRYLLSGDRLEQIDTVFPGAIEFIGKTQTTEIRLKACFDEKGTGYCFKPNDEFIFVLTETLRNNSALDN